MGHFLRFIFLTLSLLAWMTPVQAQPLPGGGVNSPLAPGKPVADFTLRSVKGWGQRLAEQRGKSVMLVWLEDCYECEEQLAPYQLLAESLADDGQGGNQLVTWFIWPQDEDDQPPRMRLPVLVYQSDWQPGWLFAQRPAVMLINPEQILDHVLIGDLDEQIEPLKQLLPGWLTEQSAQSLATERH